MEHLLSPEPEISGGSIKRRDLQYQYLLDCSKIIAKWIMNNNEPLGKHNIFSCKEFSIT